jgi:hypothetical protein
VDPKDLELSATVRLSPAARDADSTVEIRLDGAVVADGNRFHPVSPLEDLNPEFMSEDPWVGEKGLTAAECMQVGSTHAHPVDANEGFARARCDRTFHRSEREPTWGFETEGYHGKGLSCFPGDRTTM